MRLAANISEICNFDRNFHLKNSDSGAKMLPRPSARILALVALALWAASLTQIAIVIYFDQRQFSGMEILTLGWLGPLALNIAWYANPLFLYTALRMFGDRPAFTSIILATLLSLDAWLYSSHLLNEGGSKSLIYGYGWGYVLWLTSFTVLMSAVGTRWLELRASGIAVRGSRPALRPIGFLLTAATLLTTGVNSIRDHSIANAAESERLAGLAFKRRSVCVAETIMEFAPLSRPDNPIELRFVDPSGFIRWHPFPEPKQLLEWGVPAVRFDGRDYRYTEGLAPGVVQSRTAEGPASGLLSISVKQLELTWQHPVTEAPHVVHARLEETTTGRVVFDQTWIQEEDTQRYCPDYSSYAKQEEQPRALILHAVGKQFVQSDQNPPKAPQAADNFVTGSLSRESNAIGNIVLGPPASEHTNSVLFVADPAEAGVSNCPSQIRWQQYQDESLMGSLQPVRPLIVGELAFFPDRRLQFSAYCDGEFVYLNSDHVEIEAHYLTVEKRRINNFQLQWTGIVKIDSSLLPEPKQRIELYSVSEEPEQPFKMLVGRSPWPTGIWIQAPLRTGGQ